MVLTKTELAILDLLRRANGRVKVRLSAAGEDILSVQKTTKGDSFGLRIAPRGTVAAERPRVHYQAIVTPGDERFELLGADEDGEEGTDERHDHLVDASLKSIPAGFESAAKSWMLGLVRHLCAVGRFARAEDLADERFLVVDRDAMLSFLATLPTTKRKKKPVVEIDAVPLMSMLKVLDGADFLALRSVGGRLVRRRGRLAISHIATAHPDLDIVALLPFVDTLDAFPAIFAFMQAIGTSGMTLPPVPPVDDVMTDLRPMVEQLAYLPEVMCRAGVLRRSELGVSKTVRCVPGIGVPRGLVEELLRVVEAEMAESLATIG